MQAAIYAVEHIGLDIVLRLSIADRAKILRLLRKRDWADLPVTIEINEGGVDGN
jgi:hypothetical protein